VLRIKHPSKSSMLARRDRRQVAEVSTVGAATAFLWVFEEAGAEDPWGPLSLGPFYQKALVCLRPRSPNLTDYRLLCSISMSLKSGTTYPKWIGTPQEHPSFKVVPSVGDDVESWFLDIDEDRPRISLGIKQCKINPWKSSSSKFHKGDKILGSIKVDHDFRYLHWSGRRHRWVLVHLGPTSPWNESCEEASASFQEGRRDRTVILVC